MMNASPSIFSEPSSQKLPFPFGKGSFFISCSRALAGRGGFTCGVGFPAFVCNSLPIVRAAVYGLHRPHGVYPADTASSLELNWI
jgi:hypothetical protein